MLDEDLSEHSESRRHVEARLLHRYLMASPAHEVYKKLSERTEAHDHIDFVLENALLDRDDPLITLGIAKFCKESGVASRVFDISSGDDDESRLIRKALISNHLLNDVPASYFSLPSYFLKKGNYENFNDSLQELIVYLKKIRIRDSDDFYDTFENRNAIVFCRKIIVAYEQGVIKGNYDFLGLIIEGLRIWLSKNYKNINNEDAGYESAYRGRLRKRKKSYAKHARRLASSVIRSEWTRTAQIGNAAAFKAATATDPVSDAAENPGTSGTQDGSQTISTLARQLAASASRAEERDKTLTRSELADKAKSILNNIVGDSYNYEALSVQRNAPRWIKALTKFGFIKPTCA